mgnify:CR=1 FL=1
MKNRIVNINILHHAGLAGMEAGLRSSLGVESSTYHDSLIYSAMIQAGIQRFRIVGGTARVIRNSEFLRRRSEEYSFDDYKRVVEPIETVVASHTLNAGKSDRGSSSLFSLTWFLSELLFSLKTKSAMVSVLPLPDVSQYAGKLTPEMFSAVSTLVRKIHCVNIDLPIPQSEVLLDDVKVFNELITSDLFASYASSHEMLESSEEKEQSAVNNILTKAKALRDNFGGLLDFRRLSLSLIPVTLSLIDHVCGKFPGSVADIFAKALTEALKSKRRVTIYNYGDTHMKLLRKYCQASLPRAEKAAPTRP